MCCHQWLCSYWCFQSAVVKVPLSVAVVTASMSWIQLIRGFDPPSWLKMTKIDLKSFNEPKLSAQVKRANISQQQIRASLLPSATWKPLQQLSSSQTRRSSFDFTGQIYDIILITAAQAPPAVRRLDCWYEVRADVIAVVRHRRGCWCRALSGPAARRRATGRSWLLVSRKMKLSPTNEEGKGCKHKHTL